MFVRSTRLCPSYPLLDRPPASRARQEKTQHVRRQLAAPVSVTHNIGQGKNGTSRRAVDPLLSEAHHCPSYTVCDRPPASQHEKRTPAREKASDNTPHFWPCSSRGAPHLSRLVTPKTLHGHHHAAAKLTVGLVAVQVAPSAGACVQRGMRQQDGSGGRWCLSSWERRMAHENYLVPTWCLRRSRATKNPKQKVMRKHKK